MPTPVTVYRHLAPCRHRLPGWAVELPPSPPVASRGAGHGVPSHCGASDAVPPAVLPRAARGGLLPAMGRAPGGAGRTDAVRRKGRVPYLDSRAALVGMPPPHTPWSTPWPGSWHALCSLSMRRKALSYSACSQEATDESASYMLSHPTSCLSIRRTASPASGGVHASTSSVQGGVIRPGVRTRHGCGSPVLAAPHLVLCLDADGGHGCADARVSRGAGAPLACREGGHTSVPLAMLPADEPTGSSCYVGEPLPWACMAAKSPCTSATGRCVEEAGRCCRARGSVIMAEGEHRCIPVSC